jgi:hypothetical protein
MDEASVFAKVPSWLIGLGTGGAAIVGAAVFLRQFLSSAKVDRAADAANVATIERLTAEVENERKRADSERDRADQLMHEREDMIREIGELKGKVDTLTAQVAQLTDLVVSLKRSEA